MGKTMPKPNIKYRVKLAAEERAFLQNLAGKGKTAGHRIRRAQIFLALDETPQNRRWTDAKIGPPTARAADSGDLEKTFTSFSHTMSDIANALSANGMKTARLNEYDYDIGLADAYDGKGFPLSFILISEKPA